MNMPADLPTSTILLIIWVHYVADFLLQNQWMATNKNRNNIALCAHCAMYCIPFVIFGIGYAVVNTLIHMVVDKLTSKATFWLWKWEHERAFFAMIGFDQAVHIACLILTSGLIYKGLLI